MSFTNLRLPAKPSAFFVFMLILGTFLLLQAKTVAEGMVETDVVISLNESSLKTEQQTTVRTPSVVELFTSEGCSSCPPADKLLALAQKEFKEDAIVLSYHVDYWDRLGWKDPFSKRVYTERQRQYAQHFNLKSIYTPQAVVNGITEFVGSNKSALWNAISSFESAGHRSIEMEASHINDQQLTIKYSYSALKSTENIVLELVLKAATIQVKHGENGGSTLSHINIVHDIFQTKESKGIATFNLTVNFVKENYLVVAFVQDKNTYAITGAKRVAIM